MSSPSTPMQLVERLCAEQRSRWLNGDRVFATTLLEKHPTLADEPDCAVELIYNEVLLREQHGETPHLDEYLQRFPHLTTQLKRLFEVHGALGSEYLLPSHKTDLATRRLSVGARLTMIAACPAVPGYDVLGELGHGGMGVVYQARHRALNRLVALKMIRTGAHADAEERARFRTEAEAAARLQHPNLVQIFDVGEADGRPYLALEYVDGGSLAQMLAGTPQPAWQAAQLVETLTRAMHIAHQAGLVHRDLKPANVLLASGGREPPVDGEETGGSRPPLARFVPKIADFGLAKRVTAEPGTSVSGGQTQADAILGTPSYMAPEQAEGKAREVGPAADIYALGAILYELVTGRPPFLGETPLDTLMQIKTQDPVPPRRLQPKVPRDLETICLKCLHKEPARRYADAQALADDLRRFQAGEPIKARPVGRLERGWLWCRRNPGRAALTGALVLAVLVLVFGGGGAWMWIRGQREARAVAFQAGMERASGLLEEGKWGPARAAVEALPEPENEAGKRGVQEFLKDLDMLERVTEIRAGKADLFDAPAIDADYARAFRDYGIDVETLDAEEAANRIRARPDPVARELVGAIMDWAHTRGSWKLEAWKPLITVARAADQDPWRKSIRDLVLKEDFAALRQQAEDPEVLRQSAHSLHMLGTTLAVKDLPAAVELLRKAQRRYPGDVWINYRLARFLELVKPPQREAAIGYYRAAVAIRPELTPSLANALARIGQLDEALALLQALTRSRPHNVRHFNNLGTVHQMREELPEALAACDEALRLRPDYVEAHCSRGAVLTDLGCYEEAFAAFDKALRLQPNHARSHHGRGLTLMEFGEDDEALAAFDEAIHHQPDYVDAHHNRGALLSSRKGQTKEALAAFDLVLQYQPDHVLAHYNRGNMLLKLDRPREALTAYDQAILHRPSYVLSHISRGHALTDLGRLPEALAAWDRAIELKADSVDAHNNRGDILRRLERLPEALAAVDRALELSPDLAPGHYNRGLILKHSKVKRYAEAVAAFDRYLELKPNIAEAHYERGLALMFLRRFADALADADRAIELKLNTAEVHRLRGQVLMALGRLVESASAYERATVLKPDWASAHYAHGLVLGHSKLKRYTEAVAAFDRAIELNPDDAEAHTERGIVLLHLKETTRALAALNRALELKPNLARAHFGRSEVLIRLGQFADALIAADRAIELRPDNADAHGNRGLALGNLGRFADALSAIDRAIELQQDHAEFHRLRGQFLMALGRLVESASAYKCATVLRPDWAAAHYARGQVLADMGRHAEAAVAFGEAIRCQEDFPQAYCGLGLTLMETGRLTEALEALKRGHELGSRRPGWRSPSQQWISDCERLIELDRKLPALLSSEFKLATADEATRCANLCRSRGRRGAELRFYEEAFAADPKLVLDLNAGHRHNAAVAAALIGCGGSKDDPPPDEPTRARRRKQALDWLRADLEQLAKLAEGTPQGRAQVRQYLLHCRHDPDLAGLRDATALAKLSEPERDSWRQFWTEVDQLLAKVITPK